MKIKLLRNKKAEIEKNLVDLIIWIVLFLLIGAAVFFIIKGLIE